MPQWSFDTAWLPPANLFRAVKYSPLSRVYKGITIHSAACSTSATGRLRAKPKAYRRSSEAAVVVFRRLVSAGEGLLIVPVFGDFAVLHAEDVDVGALLARRRRRHLAQQPHEIAFGRGADELERRDWRASRRGLPAGRGTVVSS